MKNAKVVSSVASNKPDGLNNNTCSYYCRLYFVVYVL